jgi:uncharacterized membrane protein YvlD (DUF360 family)
MQYVLLSWLSLSAGLWLVAQVLPGFQVNGFKGALVVGAVFGVLHFFIGWFLFVMIGLGTLLLGFVFAFVTRWFVTAVILKITDAVSDNLTIDRFRTALIASGLLSILSALEDVLFRR